MKRLTRIFAASVLVALAHTIAISQLAASFARPIGDAQEALARLKGIVVEPTYARVLHTTIVFKNLSFKKEVTVDEEGAYEVEVPAGTYLVKANSAGFRESRLKVDVLPDVTKTLNIMLKVKPQSL